MSVIRSSSSSGSSGPKPEHVVDQLVGELALFAAVELEPVLGRDLVDQVLQQRAERRRLQPGDGGRIDPAHRLGPDAVERAGARRRLVVRNRSFDQAGQRLRLGRRAGAASVRAAPDLRPNRPLIA